MTHTHAVAARRRPDPFLAAAVALGGLALVNHLVARKAERRWTPEGRRLRVDGVSLRYMEQGDGQPIVLLHGNNAVADDFRISGLFDLLARSYRVIAFDRPGFGQSERPRSGPWTATRQAALLNAALDELGVERAIICGHSWGTLVALRMASAAPERVAGLVLMSGYYYPTPRADAVALGLPSLPLLGDLLRYTLSPLLGWLSTPLFFKLLFAPRTVTPRFARAFPVAIALRPSQIRASAAESALMPQEAATLGRARSRHGAPVLVVAGTKDRLVSYRHQSERLAREVPNATLVGIEGAGHMVHHSEPARVSDAIAAFAQRVFCPRPRG